MVRRIEAANRGPELNKTEFDMPICVITGANRGIGLEMARLYANRGVTVIATARDPKAATALTELKVKTGNVEIVALDVENETSFADLKSAIGGRAIDILIANAGVMGPRGALDDPGNVAATWAHVMAVNVTGAVLTLITCAPHMAKSGKIALISSKMASSSTAAAGTSYLYRASKAAVANVGANLAVEMKPKGIAVGIYHPGWVQTDMGGKAADIAPTTSAEGLVTRIDHLSLATTGVFEDYAGKSIAF
jgi:NAD(P)-dependent dehydrogenase (short-subunit alcohol dehydrogenase family)